MEGLATLAGELFKLVSTDQLALSGWTLSAHIITQHMAISLLDTAKADCTNLEYIPHGELT